MPQFATQLLNQMFSEIPGLDFYQKLHFLSNCNCCNRHQINKPIVFQPWIDTPNTSHFDYSENCYCRCRHAARMICRQCPDNHDNNDNIIEPPSPNSVIT